MKNIEELSLKLLKEAEITVTEFEEFWLRYDNLLTTIKDNIEEMGIDKIYIKKVPNEKN